MTRSDGIEILTGKRLDHLDGPWWYYECEYYFPSSETKHIGSLEGDGEGFAWDTLQDMNGDKVTLNDAPCTSCGKPRSILRKSLNDHLCNACRAQESE